MRLHLVGAIALVTTAHPAGRYPFADEFHQGQARAALVAKE